MKSLSVKVDGLATPLILAARYKQIIIHLLMGQVPSVRFTILFYFLPLFFTDTFILNNIYTT